MTPPEAARRLGLSAKHVRSLVESGELEGYRKPNPVRNTWRVSASSIDRLLARRALPQPFTQVAAIDEARARRDLDMGPCVFVLEDDLIRRKAWRHIDFAQQTIDFQAIRERCDASSEIMLVDAAEALWTDRADCRLGSLVHRLDSRALRRVVLAIELRMRWKTLAEARAALKATNSDMP